MLVCKDGVRLWLRKTHTLAVEAMFGESQSMKRFKFVVFALILLVFFASMLPFYPLLFLMPDAIRPVLILFVSFYSKILMRVLGIRAEFKNSGLIKNEANFLIVSNHLSYLDVLILSSRFPAAFVTSQEVKESPFLGQIVSLAGCLFVERRNRSGIRNEIAALGSTLKCGMNVTIFPEATSTNGDGIKQFKRSLFEAALVNRKKVLPVTINYTSINSRPVDPSNRDILCWYGDMDFFPHFLKLLDQREILVEITLSEPIAPDGQTSRTLADESFLRVSNSYKSFSITQELV